MMEVFSVLTGVDLGKMGEEHQKDQEEDEEDRKKKEEEAKIKRAEEEKRKKEEAEAALPPDEKEKLEKKKAAEAQKNLGNTAYKNKDFAKAIELYNKAIEHDPTELTYYTNKAAVFFEMKEYGKCIDECDLAIQKSKEGYYDYVKLAKALSRKGNAYLQMGNYEQAIEIFQAALLENNDHTTKDLLKKAEKLKKEAEEKAYLDPTKAEEHKIKGNEYF